MSTIYFIRIVIHVYCIFIIYTRYRWNIHLHPVIIVVMINVSKNYFPHMFEHLMGNFFSNRIILYYIVSFLFLFYLVDAPWQYVSNLVLLEYFQSIYLYRLRKLSYRCTAPAFIYVQCTYYIYIRIHHLLEPHCKHTGIENDLRCVYKVAAGILYLCLMSLSSGMITCTMHFLLCKPSRVDPSNFLQTTGHSAFLNMHQRVLPAVYIIYNVICKYELLSLFIAVSTSRIASFISSNILMSPVVKEL